MSDGLELHDSRVSHIEWLDGRARVHFSLAYIHKSQGRPGRDPGTVWGQEAELILEEAAASTASATLPNVIADGFVEVGGVRHELIPLPFQRKVAARLYLQFADGTSVEIAGQRPRIELLGAPLFIEGFS